MGGFCGYSQLWQVSHSGLLGSSHLGQNHGVLAIVGSGSEGFVEFGHKSADEGVEVC